MLQHRALPTSGVKTPAFQELFGTAEAVPSRELPAYGRQVCEMASSTSKKRGLNLSIRPPLVRHTSRAEEIAVEEEDMTRQRQSQRVRPSAGAAIVGLGLAMLLGGLDGGAVQVSHLLGAAVGEALGVLPCVTLAAWQIGRAHV